MNINYTLLFSIIVTCYKMEEYIEAVIKSVQDQGCKSIEIIVVDDGSPDNCGKILDCCALKDNRIKVIHRKNGGPGAARNSGVEAAVGEYIFFLDGDDRMCENILGKVEKIILDKHPDIIASTEHLYTNWEKSYIRKEQLERDENLKLNIAKDTYLAHNFYRRQMILDNNRPFSEEKKLAEDQEWLLNNVHCAKTFSVFNGAFYYHFERRAGSQVNGFSDAKLIPTILTWAKMYHDIDTLQYSDSEKNDLKHYTSSVFLSTLTKGKYSTNDVLLQNRCREIFRDNYDIITSKHNKMRLIGPISKIIGVDCAFKLCNLYYNLKQRI